MSNGDPIGAHLPKGKSNAQRKGRYDGSYTPTEQRTKDRLMKQFCRDEGPPPSQAYLDSPCWCECGRLKAEGSEQCAKCLGMDAKAPGIEAWTPEHPGGLYTFTNEQRAELHARMEIMLAADVDCACGRSRAEHTSPRISEKCRSIDAD